MKNNLLKSCLFLLCLFVVSVCSAQPKCPVTPVKESAKQPIEAESTTDDQSYLSSDAVTINNPQLNFIPLDIDVPGQSFVSTGPYIGVPLLFAGSNLIINSPNINEDVTLLKVRKSISERLRALGRPHNEDHAHLLLSGIVEGAVIYRKPGKGSPRSDVDLTSAELDGYILGPSSWTSALIAFAYDNNIGSETGSLTNNSRIQNSRLFLNKAFIIIGDFEQSPFYGTIGQMYVPFGTYSTNMISSPLTKILARTKARAILFGYQQQTKNAFYASVYAFRGDSIIHDERIINNGGINLGYRYNCGVLTGDFGGGMIVNLADSIGLQYTGNQPRFGGFASPHFGNEHMRHQVPALNLRGVFAVGDHIDLLAEYVGAVRTFARRDLSYNHHAASPKAFNAEAVYTFTAFDRPTSFAVGYGWSQDALAIGLPWQRGIMTLNTSWWKDTLQSVEFRHDINYPSGDVSSGSGIKGPNGPGKPDNAVTGQFDIYF